MNSGEKIIEIYNKQSKFRFPRIARPVQTFFTALIVIPSWILAKHYFPDTNLEQEIILWIGYISFSIISAFLIGDIITIIINRINKRRRKLIWNECLKLGIIPNSDMPIYKQFSQVNFFNECMLLLESANAKSRGERESNYSRIKYLGAKYDQELNEGLQ